jgi:hypothetical protein
MKYRRLYKKFPNWLTLNHEFFNWLPNKEKEGSDLKIIPMVAGDGREGGGRLLCVEDGGGGDWWRTMGGNTRSHFSVREK